MGGIVSGAAAKTSSALEAFGGQKSGRDYYRSLAADADYQADYTAQASRRQAAYLFKSAAERSRDVYAAYRQTAASQKTAMAASGLSANSDTVRRILKNTRLSALMDERTVRENLLDALYENDASAAERIRALNASSAQYRRAAKNALNGWSVGGTILDWLSR